MTRIAPYWKAVVGFVAPGAVILTSAVLETSHQGDSISQAEAVTALCACVITSAAVAAKGNAPRTEG